MSGKARTASKVSYLNESRAARENLFFRRRCGMSHPRSSRFLAYLDTSGASNGGAEAINGLIELHRRIARASRDSENYRVRMLLIGGGLSQGRRTQVGRRAQTDPHADDAWTSGTTKVPAPRFRRSGTRVLVPRAES